MPRHGIYSHRVRPRPIPGNDQVTRQTLNDRSRNRRRHDQQRITIFRRREDFSGRRTFDFHQFHTGPSQFGQLLHKKRPPVMGGLG